ncbi:DegT/DnrJ/EryC1/StrS family aminotransferase [Deltaproteobacteria bacterium OttesenSCG-928-K17]|nr:DegT/DnrJ/EryC1/StrS family aminotransferase [Deltaproteobacteria bacterium OttesenSCG-928-K17]
MKYDFIDLKKQYAALEADINAGIRSVLERCAFIGGSEVAELEKALAGYLGTAEVVACGNGTTSLEMALMALGLGEGDAVFCPAFTFIATAEVVSLRGARPVFVDIDPRTYNIDPADLEEKIQAVKKEGRYRPKGVIPVDLFGLPADYPALEKIAERHGLFILEDAAQGFGGDIRGRKAGSFGLAASLSFFPAKPLGCYGDGGAVMTGDAKLAATLRSLRVHGAGSHKYEHVLLGTNSRLDTIQAAVLLVKLKAFPGELQRRQEVAAAYSAVLGGLCQTPYIPAGYTSGWAQYTVRVPAGQRAAIMDELKGKGIPTMIYYPKPLHLQPAFAALGGRAGDLPAAEAASDEVLSLPMHPYLSNEDVRDIAGALAEILKR